MSLFMDRVVRHKKNGRYLAASGKWVRDLSLAQTFYFVEDARLFCLDRGIMSDVECVVNYGTVEAVLEIFAE